MLSSRSTVEVAPVAGLEIRWNAYAPVFAAFAVAFANIRSPKVKDVASCATAPPVAPCAVEATFAAEERDAVACSIQTRAAHAARGGRAGLTRCARGTYAFDPHESAHSTPRAAGAASIPRAASAGAATLQWFAIRRLRQGDVGRGQT